MHPQESDGDGPGVLGEEHDQAHRDQGGDADRGPRGGRPGERQECGCARLSGRFSRTCWCCRCRRGRGEEGGAVGHGKSVRFDRTGRHPEAKCRCSPECFPFYSRARGFSLIVRVGLQRLLSSDGCVIKFTCSRSLQLDPFEDQVEGVIMSVATVPRVSLGLLEKSANAKVSSGSVHRARGWPLRLSLSPSIGSGALDGAWWPYSHDLRSRPSTWPMLSHRRWAESCG
jgi:hypothetical protein